MVEIGISRNFHFIDCQVHTPHLEKMGAVQVREMFLTKLNASLNTEPKKFKWDAII